MNTAVQVLKNLLGMVFLLGLSGLFIYLGYDDIRNSRLLTKEGKAVDADVQEGFERTRRFVFKDYQLKIGFRAESGDLVSKKIEVDGDTFRAGMADRLVSVLYLPANPSIVGTGKVLWISYASLVGGVALVLVSFLSLANWLHMRQQV